MGVDQRILVYYSRKDVQKAILESAQHREVAVRFGDGGYGRRPDVLVYESDIHELAKQGATSFHLSEEQWHDPLKLRTGMIRKQLDELRRGWDLVLDIDCPFIEFSKITAKLLMDALHFHNVHAFGLKFSGNRGFHIAVPFSSFPPAVDSKHTPLLFPEGPRMIAEYLSSMIKEHLIQQVQTISTPREIAEATAVPLEKIAPNSVFDPFAVVGIDTVLISSRHLFRSPYSINEKSGMASIVIPQEKLSSFRPAHAKVENIETVHAYLPHPESEHEAGQLLIQAFDYAKKKSTIIQPEEQPQSSKNRLHADKKVSEDLFPPCIKLIFLGVQVDGRKRAILVLINFLRQMNYTMEEIEALLHEWNKKNYEPLREGYIRSQISWYRRNTQSLLPPNCANDAYYVPMGVCRPDNFCSKIKNPANYALLKMRMQQEYKPKKGRQRKQKGQ